MDKLPIPTGSLFTTTKPVDSPVRPRRADLDLPVPIQGNPTDILIHSTPISKNKYMGAVNRSVLNNVDISSPISPRPVATDNHSSKHIRAITPPRNPSFHRFRAPSPEYIVSLLDTTNNDVPPHSQRLPDNLLAPVSSPMRTERLEGGHVDSTSNTCARRLSTLSESDGGGATVTHASGVDPAHRTECVAVKRHERITGPNGLGDSEDAGAGASGSERVNSTAVVRLQKQLTTEETGEEDGLDTKAEGETYVETASGSVHGSGRRKGGRGRVRTTITEGPENGGSSRKKSISESLSKRGLPTEDVISETDDGTMMRNRRKTSQKDGNTTKPATSRTRKNASDRHISESAKKLGHRAGKNTDSPPPLSPRSLGIYKYFPNTSPSRQTAADANATTSITTNPTIAAGAAMIMLPGRYAAVFDTDADATTEDDEEMEEIRKYGSVFRNLPSTEVVTPQTRKTRSALASQSPMVALDETPLRTRNQKKLHTPPFPLLSHIMADDTDLSSTEDEFSDFPQNFPREIPKPRASRGNNTVLPAMSSRRRARPFSGTVSVPDGHIINDNIAKGIVPRGSASPGIAHDADHGNDRDIDRDSSRVGGGTAVGMKTRRGGGGAECGGKPPVTEDDGGEESEEVRSQEGEKRGQDNGEGGGRVADWSGKKRTASRSRTRTALARKNAATVSKSGTRTNPDGKSAAVRVGEGGVAVADGTRTRARDSATAGVSAGADGVEEGEGDASRSSSRGKTQGRGRGQGQKSTPDTANSTTFGAPGASASDTVTKVADMGAVDDDGGVVGGHERVTRKSARTRSSAAICSNPITTINASTSPASDSTTAGTRTRGRPTNTVSTTGAAMATIGSAVGKDTSSNTDVVETGVEGGMRRPTRGAGRRVERRGESEEEKEEESKAKGRGKGRQKSTQKIDETVVNDGNDDDDDAGGKGDNTRQNKRTKAGKEIPESPDQGFLSSSSGATRRRSSRLVKDHNKNQEDYSTSGKTRSSGPPLSQPGKLPVIMDHPSMENDEDMDTTREAARKKSVKKEDQEQESEDETASREGSGEEEELDGKSVPLRRTVSRRKAVPKGTAIAVSLAATASDVETETESEGEGLGGSRGKGKIPVKEEISEKRKRGKPVGKEVKEDIVATSVVPMVGKVPRKTVNSGKQKKQESMFTTPTVPSRPLPMLVSNSAKYDTNPKSGSIIPISGNSGTSATPPIKHVVHKRLLMEYERESQQRQRTITTVNDVVYQKYLREVSEKRRKRAEKREESLQQWKRTFMQEQKKLWLEQKKSCVKQEDGVDGRMEDQGEAVSAAADSSSSSSLSSAAMQERAWQAYLSTAEQEKSSEFLREEEKIRNLEDAVYRWSPLELVMLKQAYILANMILPNAWYTISITIYRDMKQDYEKMRQFFGNVWIDNKIPIPVLRSETECQEAIDYLVHSGKSIGSGKTTAVPGGKAQAFRTDNAASTSSTASASLDKSTGVSSAGTGAAVVAGRSAATSVGTDTGKSSSSSFSSANISSTVSSVPLPRMNKTQKRNYILQEIAFRAEGEEDDLFHAGVVKRSRAGTENEDMGKTEQKAARREKENELWRVVTEAVEAEDAKKKRQGESAAQANIEKAEEDNGADGSGGDRHKRDSKSADILVYTDQKVANTPGAMEKGEKADQRPHTEKDIEGADVLTALPSSSSALSFPSSSSSSCSSSCLLSSIATPITQSPQIRDNGAKTATNTSVSSLSLPATPVKSGTGSRNTSFQEDVFRDAQTSVLSSSSSSSSSLISVAPHSGKKSGKSSLSGVFSGFDENPVVSLLTSTPMFIHAHTLPSASPDIVESSQSHTDTAKHSRSPSHNNIALATTSPTSPTTHLPRPAAALSSTSAHACSLPFRVHSSSALPASTLTSAAPTLTPVSAAASMSTPTHVPRSPHAVASASSPSQAPPLSQAPPPIASVASVAVPLLPPTPTSSSLNSFPNTLNFGFEGFDSFDNFDAEFTVFDSGTGASMGANGDRKRQRDETDMFASSQGHFSPIRSKKIRNSGNSGNSDSPISTRPLQRLSSSPSRLVSILGSRLHSKSDLANREASTGISSIDTSRSRHISSSPSVFSNLKYSGTLTGHYSQIGQQWQRAQTNRSLVIQELSKIDGKSGKIGSKGGISKKPTTKKPSSSATSIQKKSLSTLSAAGKKREAQRVQDLEVESIRQQVLAQRQLLLSSSSFSSSSSSLIRSRTPTAAEEELQHLWQETELIQETLAEVRALEDEGVEVEVEELDSILGDYMDD